MKSALLSLFLLFGVSLLPGLSKAESSCAFRVAATLADLQNEVWYRDMWPEVDWSTPKLNGVAWKVIARIQKDSDAKGADFVLTHWKDYSGLSFDQVKSVVTDRDRYLSDF